MRDHLESKFGRLNVLMNNAGIITNTETGSLDVSLAIVREALETSILTPLRMTQVLLPLPGLMGAKPNAAGEWRPTHDDAEEANKSLRGGPSASG